MEGWLDLLNDDNQVPCQSLICHKCPILRALWTVDDTINEGFPKNRTMENMRETWKSLQKREDGSVVKSTGDYETRLGLCREPVSLRDTLSFTITHKVDTT